MNKKKLAPASLIVRICVGCGTGVETRSCKLEYCVDCAKKRKSIADAAYKSSRKPNKKVYECFTCGVVCEYEGRVPKKYCPECKKNAARDAGRRCDAKRRIKTVIGTAADCKWCSTRFVKRSTNHFLCDDCSIENKNKIRAKWAEENRDKIREAAKRHNDKRRSTPQGHLEWTMRSAVRRAIGGNVKAERRTFDLLGYTTEELKTHLEKQFKCGMSWGNYGKWHIDHIIPLSKHQYKTPECPDFKKAWSLTNLQPLWAKENLSKGSKILSLI